MQSKETSIGKVISVSGSRISVQLDERVKSTMPIINGIVYRMGQIGSFVKIPLGYAQLYGVVTQAGADAVPESLKNIETEQQKEVILGSRWLTIILIGERVGDRFERGVIQYPTSDDEVHIVTIDDLEIIYGGINEESAITVGQISASESLPAQLDLDKLVTRHSAIVGSTGSGKSNAVAIILNAIASNKVLKSSRILLIDPHGEYNDTLTDFSRVFRIKADKTKGQSELHVPYWALPINELLNIFSGNLKDNAVDYLRQEILYRKIAAIDKLNNAKPIKTSVNSDSPVPFSIKKLWFDLDDFERMTMQRDRETPMALVEAGDAELLKPNRYPPPAPGGGEPFVNNKAYGILSFLDSVRNRLLDERYHFLFKPGNYEPNSEGEIKVDLNTLFSEWLGHDKSITILDLSGVPPDIMISISGTLLKIVYDALFWGQNLSVGGRQQPLLIALEEAHNYLKAGENSIASRTVQMISKEGRKYGVGLLLISQRPSELDETVLSQLGSVIALRMTNQKDRGHIAAAVQEDLHDLVGLLPSLRTGEGLIMGEVVKIPSRVKFDKIPYAPKSSDPEVTKQWTNAKPDNKEYDEVVKYWRNGKLI